MGRLSQNVPDEDFIAGYQRTNEKREAGNIRSQANDEVDTFAYRYKKFLRMYQWQQCGRLT